MEKNDQQLYTERDGMRLALIFPGDRENTEKIRENVKNVLLSELRQLLQKQGDLH